MNRTEIINKLIEKHGYQSYLEIGTQNGANFNSINCFSKLGVNPDKNSKADVHLTSDEFFVTNKDVFDIIFIDAYHVKDNAIRDIQNALDCLMEGGSIVVHDINPKSELMQQVPRKTKEWTGNVWEAWIHFRKREDLFMVAYSEDYGVGLIQKGEQKPIKPRGVDYTKFDKNRVEYLNIDNTFFND